MHELIVSPYVLALAFVVVAFLYSSVGLGGGSSYTALLVIAGASTLAIPTLSLTLNVIVTALGSLNFIRHRHARWRLIGPFFVSSIPMAYVGGSLSLPKTVFYWVLFVSLVLVALRIYGWRSAALDLKLGPAQRIGVSLVIGAVLGLIAGVAGIGGGIYLVPLIIIFGLGTPKEAAACGAVFIFVNSCAGLAARLQSGLADFSHFLPLAVAVIAGGAAGSYLGATRFAPRTMERLLGVIVLVAVVFLGRKLMTS